MGASPIDTDVAFFLLLVIGGKRKHQGAYSVIERHNDSPHYSAEGYGYHQMMISSTLRKPMGLQFFAVLRLIGHTNHAALRSAHESLRKYQLSPKSTPTTSEAEALPSIIWPLFIGNKILAEFEH